jgi:tripartite-type tricarboxylate transporter receptor subunit TctC
MIVPFAAGGPMDTVARVVADGMRASLGQPVIIENVVGAGGSIGAGRVAHAAPDGFTISYGGWPTHVINGAAYSLSYDVLNDFEPVALTASAPWLLLARNGMPAGSSDSRSQRAINRRQKHSIDCRGPRSKNGGRS